MDSQPKETSSQEETDPSSLALLRRVIHRITAIIVVLFIHAHVATLLWEWFVVPTFNMPSLPLITAVGIFLMLRYVAKTLTIRTKSITTNPESVVRIEQVDVVFYTILRAFFTLSVGWILTFIM